MDNKDCNNCRYFSPWHMKVAGEYKSLCSKQGQSRWRNCNQIIHCESWESEVMDNKKSYKDQKLKCCFSCKHWNLAWHSDYCDYCGLGGNPEDVGDKGFKIEPLGICDMYEARK